MPASAPSWRAAGYAGSCIVAEWQLGGVYTASQGAVLPSCATMKRRVELEKSVWKVAIHAERPPILADLSTVVARIPLEHVPIVPTRWHAEAVGVARPRAALVRACQCIVVEIFARKRSSIARGLCVDGKGAPLGARDPGVIVATATNQIVDWLVAATEEGCARRAAERRGGESAGKLHVQAAPGTVHDVDVVDVHVIDEHERDVGQRAHRDRACPPTAAAAVRAARQNRTRTNRARQTMFSRLPR